MLTRSGRVASHGERFSPAEPPAGGPQGHVIGLVKRARKLQVLTSLLVLSEDCG
jgi:hypothetical protein